MRQEFEKARLNAAKENNPWKKWGPYLTERQWGTVREDYSADGSAWEFISHDMARSKAYRWGEEGIGGISDNKNLLCFAIALWNGKDDFLKERLFGVTGNQGNHGEDVKELYYYLESSPTHSYMKMLYKYPQNRFPYDLLVQENRTRTKNEPEFEILDTGIFNTNKYFDVFIEYAKGDVEDILIKINVVNRGPEKAELYLLPTVWFRNIWNLGYPCVKPNMWAQDNCTIQIQHHLLGSYRLYSQYATELLFCDNETNYKRLYNFANNHPYSKDGINDFIVHKKIEAINTGREGTKAAVHFSGYMEPGATFEYKLRLSNKEFEDPFQDFDQLFARRLAEHEAFYKELEKGIDDPELRSIQRQAYAGMMWSKQFYYFNIDQWLRGDPNQMTPPQERKKGRNHEWKHLNNSNIISMPDKWEYPWYAAWDLAFHCIPIARIDPDFAKRQLLLMVREYYMHPNGQIPAYEWSLGDVNPPVHAWATWKVYMIDRSLNDGHGDLEFLERVFHKLLINFTWWVNRKDRTGNNIFEGGFLGLDNIGVFDRSSPLPTGGCIEQADATSWMAMYALNMLRISIELSLTKPVYQDCASKFFEHFLYIAGASVNIGGEQGISLWDEEDQFFYDVLHLPTDERIPLKVRSMVGLIPLYAVETIDPLRLEKLPDFKRRLEWVLTNRPDLAALISRWYEHGKGETRLLSVLRGHRMKMLLKRLLDENEFLSEYGVRSLSKFHEDHPYEFVSKDQVYKVKYTPGESDTKLFGGNSNWRGPIWFPVNYMIIESLLKYYQYFGDEYKVELPTGSGNMVTLKEVAKDLGKRLIRIFMKDKNGNRPVYGHYKKLQTDPEFNKYILFYEYFHGETGRGVGASHQTGWTGLVAELIHQFGGDDSILREELSEQLMLDKDQLT
ncbi:MAG TPA: glucosidase [Cytophagaceae bacterium]